MPSFLKKFSSKDSPEDSPDEDPPTINKKEIRSKKNLIADPNVPQYSDAMKEAWSAANAELPQAQGAERLLNRVGTLIMSVPTAIPH